MTDTIAFNAVTGLLQRGLSCRNGTGGRRGEKLRAAGVTLIEAELPDAVNALFGTVATILAYETMPAVAAFLEAQGTGITFDQLLQQAGEGTRETLKAFALPPYRPTQDAYEAAWQRSLLARTWTVSGEGAGSDSGAKPIVRGQTQDDRAACGGSP